MRPAREMPCYPSTRSWYSTQVMTRPMMILLLALALVGVGAMTRAEAKAERQLRRAKKLQKKARAR